MNPRPSNLQRIESRLWLSAFLLASLIAIGMMLIVGFLTLQSAKRKQPTTPLPSNAATILIEPSLAPKAQPSSEKAFARTSPEQQAPPPPTAPRIGERDTQATSDQTPLASAPPLPSQSGVKPKDPDHIETTDSQYQDGSLEDPTPNSPSQSPSSSSSSKPVVKSPTVSQLPPSPRKPTTLLSGPNPIDVPTQHLPPQPTQPKASPPPPQEPAPESVTSLPKESQPTPQPPIKDPVFKGFQQKTAVIGSISRTGKSALDVTQSPLGKYQTAVSRAVELEWQRNCVRHKDFITPGFLTVRFFVQSSGKVKSVEFEGEMQTSEIQKGFTLNSIRNAHIPPMPPSLQNEFSKNPLELIFRFYF